ncbi:stage V sporulation protein AA [Aquibacillus sediminis]|uniref:stage V sporulation protein AA n=1 Tax=Aquibacillus sediminis TaxID=2574734 RepID=UPI001107B56D|nr:stage V sporulation protein AA [Aquibacillus sediminis]
MGKTIYLRLKKNIQVRNHATIKLEDIAYISGESAIISKLNDIVLYKMSEADHNVSVIDGLIVINQLIQLYPDLEIQHIGPTQTIIRVKKENKKKPSIIMVSVIWLLLFIGSSMAIMNFHYDVSMQEVQQQLHYLLTGNNSEHPLSFQIPYSIGLGVGMILFFNHLFKKRFNEEPSPLEIELYKYQQDLDNYVSYYENSLNISENGSHNPN